jgi:hypothetical protein
MAKLSSTFSQEQTLKDRKRRNRLSQKTASDMDGFKETLELVGDNYGLSASVVAELEGLAPHVKVMFLSPMDSLYGCLSSKLGVSIADDGPRGLFFVEYGLIRVERDPNSTMMRNTSTLRRRFESLEIDKSSATLLNRKNEELNKIAANVRRRKLNEAPRSTMTFSYFSRGPGTLLGGREIASDMKATGEYIAVVPSKLYFLNMARIEELDESNPKLALALHKAISSGLAASLEASYVQTNQYYDVMNSRDVVKPKSRKIAAKVRAALDRMNIE